AEEGECLAVLADPPLAGTGDTAEDRDQLVGLVGRPGRVDGERLLRVGGRRYHGRSPDDDQVTGDWDQVVESPGRQQLVEPFVVFVAGEPALRVRGAQDRGHLLA